MLATDIGRKIGISEHTLKALESVSLPAPTVSFPEIDADPAALQPFARQENGLVILRLFLEWIPIVKTRYDALGIPEPVFWDSMKDLALWTEDYWNKHHIPGFAEWEWVTNSLRTQVFRLGRLQFAPTVLAESVLCGGEAYPAGTPVLEVHIPAGEPLEIRAVEDSLRAAPVFFEIYFQQHFSLFHCHSWLLSPQLKQLLPEQSRILRFQNRFTVYAEDAERQAEERVFGYLSDDPSQYPEDTSLQRALKQALSHGLTVGMGMGILKIP